MRESVLFSFPAISLTPPHSPSSPGFLVLASSSQPTELDPSRFDIYLRLQHTPDKSSVSHPTDCLIEAWRELRKISPREFILSSEFGDLTITFPELHHVIPQNDDRIDMPAEVKRQMTWETIVREFECEVDRFVSYRKNTYSLVDSPFGGAPAYDGKRMDHTSKAGEAGYAPHSNETGVKQYDPSSFHGNEKQGGRVVLVDEENGSEVGEVGGREVNSVGIVPGSKDPVEIIFPANGEPGPLTVRPVDFLLKDATHPAYKNSTLVQTAATASRLIVTTSSILSNAMASGARTFSEKTKPNATPTTFQPITHQRFQQIQALSTTAVKFSSATVGKVSSLAQNAGARLAGKDKESNERGRPRNPNILNKSLIAFSTVADSIDYAGKTLLNSGSQAASHIVGHKYGSEAGNVAKALTGSVTNVGLVYIDAAGVSRRAVVKGVAKGMVIGKVRDGGEIVVSGNQYEPEKGDGRPGGSYIDPPDRPSSPPRYNQIDVAYETGPITGNSMYFPPPPGRDRSPAPPTSQQTSEKGGQFRF